MDNFGNFDADELGYAPDFVGEWTMFDRETARALYVIVGPWRNARSTAHATGLGVILGRAVIGEHRIVGGEFVPLEAMPIKVDGMTITGVPFPASLQIEGATMPDIDGSRVEFDFLPGDSYTVEIRRDPYLPWRHTFSL